MIWVRCERMYIVGGKLGSTRCEWLLGGVRALPDCEAHICHASLSTRVTPDLCLSRRID